MGRALYLCGARGAPRRGLVHVGDARPRFHLEWPTGPAAEQTGGQATESRAAVERARWVRGTNMHRGHARAEHRRVPSAQQRRRGTLTFMLRSSNASDSGTSISTLLVNQ